MLHLEALQLVMPHDQLGPLHEQRVAFVGIVVWAWSGRRERQFDEAANAPFALPDDATGVAAPRAPSGERQS